MKTTIATILTVGLVAIGLTIADAEAKRLGGGGSIGKQRSTITPQRAAPQQPAQSPSQAAPSAPAPQPAGARSWLGPLAGLAVGGLLGAMLFGHAFDGLKLMDFVMILLLAGAIFFVWRMLRRPQPQSETRAPVQYAGVGADPLPRVEPVAGAAPAPQRAYFPAGFDADGFIRHAKLNFVKLQAANDAKDVTTLRDFVTPELFAELSGELNSRNSEPQKTDVVTLDAEMLDVSEEGDHYIASVRFTGLIRETAAGAAEPFSETWHLEKPVNGKTGWLIAGIQQG